MTETRLRKILQKTLSTESCESFVSCARAGSKLHMFVKLLIPTKEVLERTQTTGTLWHQLFERLTWLNPTCDVTSVRESPVSRIKQSVFFNIPSSWRDVTRDIGPIELRFRNQTSRVVQIRGEKNSFGLICTLQTIVLWRTQIKWSDIITITLTSFDETRAWRHCVCRNVS